MLFDLGICAIDVGADLNSIQGLLLGCFLLPLGVIMLTVPGGGGAIGAIVILCALIILVRELANLRHTQRTPTRPRHKPTRKPRSSPKVEELRVVEPSDLICQHCGFVNPKDHSYCGSCGYPLSPEGTKVY